VNRIAPKYKTDIIMKKYFIIAAAALVASAGVNYAANSFLHAEDCSKCEVRTKCQSCNGTGWKGSFKCFMCDGTGGNGSD
jgi:hypothetical protein